MLQKVSRLNPKRALWPKRGASTPISAAFKETGHAFCFVFKKIFIHFKKLRLRF
ncbi:hypothetical protein Hanom_Chr09g00761911 [Helianthus anomalus]